jgi:Flp pilus assembly protein TadD
MTDLAVLLMVKGERAEARRLLERVLELRPDDALALSNLQRLRSLEGEG